MFVDEGGWGRPRHEAERPRRMMTERQERVVLRLVLANLLFMLIAPIGDGTVIQAWWHWWQACAEGFVAMYGTAIAEGANATSDLASSLQIGCLENVS